VDHFRADICFVDEAARVHDLDLLQVIRKHNPQLLVVVGDPQQLGPSVQRDSDGYADNPWAEYCRVSTPQRAFNAGVVDTNLRYNHRSACNLSWLPSKLFYWYEMVSPPNSPWPETANAWHRWLLRYAPQLRDHRYRILLELQGSEVQHLASSCYNLTHVEKDLCHGP
jgi:hypothetical protein